MTVREFASKSGGSAMIKIVNSGTLLLSFDSQFWQYITDAVLDLEILDFQISNHLMKKAEVTVNVTNGEIVYVTDQEALQIAINDDDVSVIILSADIEPGEDNVIVRMTGGEKTLYLNGHSIYAPEGNTEKSCAAFYVTAGKLTIFGDRECVVFGGKESSSNNAVWANGPEAEIEIHGGVYDVGLAANRAINSAVYARDGGVILIYDGYFTNSGSDSLGVTEDRKCVLNVNDNNDDSRIVCYGGSYRNQNPEDGDRVNRENGKTFLAPGCKVVEEEIDEDTVIYSVVSGED